MYPIAPPMNLKPYSEEPWHYLSMGYENTGDLKSAKEAGDKMLEVGLRKLEVNPEDGVVLGRMAIAYATTGVSKKALEAAKRAMEIDPNDGVALYNCSITYACLGRKEEALTYLKAALDCGLTNIIDWIEKVDPYLKSIRDDPRFREIISKYSI